MSSPALPVKPRRVHVAIIGSGPCGLGAAWRLEELARIGLLHAKDWVVLDAALSSGGLAGSEVDAEGFTWDMGGHVIFSHYAYFSRLLDALLPTTEWRTLEREAWVWMRQRFVPYPLQQNLHHLPSDDISACVDGLLDVESQRTNFEKPVHFGDWLLQSFGKGLCDTFMTPYNKKVWGYDPSQMNTEWMGERVATVNVKLVLQNIIHQRDEIGWGPNSTFRFPLHGGTGAIWNALFQALPHEKFQFGNAGRVIQVDMAAKLLTLADGSQIGYKHLISTMPMDCLCQIARNVPNHSREQLEVATTKFRHSSSHIIGIGLEGKPPAHLQTKCWLYFPENNAPFYRVTVFSNYSPHVVPKQGNQWSLMMEVSESPSKPVCFSTLVAEVEQGARNCQLISDTDVIVSRFHKKLDYGYPTPFLGRDALIAPLHTAFESAQVLSRGRFGSWKYEVSNQDHTLMLGVEAVDRALLGTDEITQNHASVVNARRDQQGRVPIIVGSPLDKE